ncbi:hypothetical protein D9757_004612 [Collybiopsis confluens]|uniref:Uncharacterized protein n=1 Tax=Collybiopsis confluens TaxID=2823264 RepID=A0A8H5MC51_9AGAR|nr:hypothetical protein D9757_004612 [Collybiopsis confluens]
MDDKPYTTPDEDPFNVRPATQPRRRRSSMLDKWIHEQQQSPSNNIPPNKTCPPRGHPYLAYPDLDLTHEARSHCNSAMSLGSFELVDEADIPQDVCPEVSLLPSTPTSTTPKSSRGTPKSFRGLRISLRPQSPARSLSPVDSLTPRKSFLPLSSRLGGNSQKDTSRQHNRSTSLSMSQPPASAAPESSPTSSKWRPSVLGYFSSSTTSQDSFIPSETLYTPSRPSVSSNTTFISTTTASTSVTATAIDNDMAEVYSFRSPPQSFRNPRVGKTHSENNVSTTSAPSFSKHGSLRVPLAPKAGMRLANSNLDSDDEGPVSPVVAVSKPEIVFKSNTLPKMSFATLLSKSSKKKRLIVSGIAPNDVRKFDGVRNWSEGFGEVSHIIRMPNGDLHVHFRSAEVADTVCRLRAKVYIVGCGSVNVSWTTGNFVLNLFFVFLIATVN